MNSSSSILDRWLVASEAAYTSLAGFWRTEAGPGSLLDWRLANGLVEKVAIDEMENRIGGLAESGAPDIVVVVDRADVPLLRSIGQRGARSDIDIIEWRQNPLDAVMRMNAPDRATLAALRRSSGTICQVIDASELPDPQGYIASLGRWEANCRASGEATFAEAYPQYASTAIPWTALISRSPEAVAANDNWVALELLAAASGDDPERPFSFDDPRNTPAQWRLTLSPVDGGPETLVVFRANDAAISSFVGQRIRVRAQGRTVDLGEVDEEGRAELLLPFHIEMQGLSISWAETE